MVIKAALELQKRFTRKLRSDIAGGLDLLSTGFSRPIRTTSGLIQLARPSTRKKGAQRLFNLVEETRREPAKKTIFKTLGTTAAASSLLLAPSRKIIFKGIGAGTSGLIRGTGAFITKKPITTILGAPIVAGFAVGAPKFTRKFISPERRFKGSKTFGADVEQKGIIQATKDLFTSKPAKTAGLVGLGAAGTVAGIKGAQIIRERLTQTKLQQVALPSAVGNIPVESQTVIPTQQKKKEVKEKEMKPLQPIKVIVKPNITLRNRTTPKNYINVGIIN